MALLKSGLKFKFACSLFCDIFLVMTNCIFAFIILLEPRGAQEDFENVLKDYYDTIRQGKKPTTTGRRRGKKVDASATMSKGNINKGATFLAVCRGKVFRFPATSKSYFG